MPELIGVIVTLFFVGIVFRGLFPKVYGKLHAAVSKWADAPEQKSKAPKDKTNYPVGIKHQ